MICGSNSVFSSLLVCWHNILVTLIDRGELHTTRKRSRNGLPGDQTDDLLEARFWIVSVTANNSPGIWLLPWRILNQYQIRRRISAHQGQALAIG
jgi:hypothetical protein